MADIIERLRIESRREPHEPIWRDAIDEIEALRAEVDRLREALKGLITWVPSAGTYRRLGFDPQAPMRALGAARAAMAAQPVTHPDDAAVDRFAAAMKAKLAKKRAEGRGGWDDKAQCTGEFLSALLREHVDKGDPLDVGNLAMMLHQRGERISAEPAASAEHATCNLRLATQEPVACAYFTEKGEVAYTGIYDRTLKALERVKTTRMGISAGSIDLYAAPVAAQKADDARDAARYRWLKQHAFCGVWHRGEDVQLDAVKSTAAIAWGWLWHVTTADARVNTARDLLEQMLDKDLRRYGIQTAKAEGAQEIEDEQP